MLGPGVDPARQQQLQHDIDLGKASLDGGHVFALANVLRRPIVVYAHVGLEGVSAQLASAVSGLDGNGRQSPMWRPCPRTGGGGSQHKEGTLEAAASALLVGPVKAAWQALKAFVDETYLPAVASGRSVSVACADLPNGKAW